MNFHDRDLTCGGCGVRFVFSAGEQQFFHEKGFTHEPKRCRQCKIKQSATGKPVVDTHVKCSECGQETIVPFKPSQNRPVLCRACFDKARRVAALFANS